MISIIIPVYNAQNTIKSTIDSLLRQSFKELEIICIDDGSKDNSLKILQEYEQKYQEITVIHQSNQGVSSARNAGISNANGNIVMFVDADDELVPRACEYVNDIFTRTQTEVLTFGFKAIPDNLIPLGMKAELKPPNKIYNGFIPDLLFKDKSRPYICRTAISKSLLDREHISFEPEISLGEDQIIYFLLYPLAKKVILSPKQLYIYKMNRGSATHTNAFSSNGAVKKLEQHLAVIETIMNEWRKRNLSHLCSSELLDWMLDFVLFDINNLADSELRTSYYRRLYNSFCAYFQNDPTAISKNPITSICLKQLQQISSAQNSSSTNRISLCYISAFYLKRYGLIRCIQQALISFGMIKKWK